MCFQVKSVDGLLIVTRLLWEAIQFIDLLQIPLIRPLMPQPSLSPAYLLKDFIPQSMRLSD
jgi:hypothetical protein